MKLVIDTERMKALRKMQYDSQAALAQAAGVCAKTVEHAENGRSVSDKTVHAIARALKVKPADLATLTPDE